LLEDMADNEIRVERARDADRYLASDKLVWFDDLSPEPTDVQLRGVPEDQRFSAEIVGSDVDPATYAAVYGVRPMQLSVPDGSGAGAVVPVAGLTWVGVHPDHRRRGLLTAMMRHHFEQTRSEGVHLSVLHASEPQIYGRHGYGLASLELEVSIGRGATLTAPHLEAEAAAVTTRFATITDPGVPERRRRIDLDLMPGGVGLIVGDDDFYAMLCHPSPQERRDGEPQRMLFATRDGQDVGYVSFRRKHKWTDGRPAAEVSVGPVSGGPAVRLALLRRVTDLDLAGSAKLFGVGESDPLLSWVQGPRSLGAVLPYDSLWVRLVDLPQALAARRYEADCDVVVEVADEAAPWNAGRWRIRVKDGDADVTRSDDEAEVSLPVASLGAAYLGGGNLAAQHRAGLLTEHRPDAVRDLWRAFRTDVGPYASRGF
jgi:GNAT superfamily N-acetyltransferase